MSDDIVVVDNGSIYETQESAIVAKNEADRAEQWAKYSEEKANLADERAVDAAESSDAAAQAATAAIEAKQYAETAITDENLIVVATDLKSTPSNIKKTAGSIDNVNTVGKDIENINAVAANKVNIDKVAADKDNIDTVATNIVNVNTVAKNIDNVNLLAPHTEAMEALAPDIMDVVTVAGITEQTKNVSENMAHVVAVDNNKANIDKAVANEANITTVATSINNVNAVAGNKANIDSVAANKTNINNVAENIAAVNNVSENMVDVKAAVQSANDAKLWAVGTITEKPEGSSKYWAEQAQQTAQVYDASETVKGIVRLSTSEEAKAGLDDKTAITPLKLKQNIVDNVGRVNQLGFNGVLQSGVITFTPDQGTYELKAGYEYEIDLLFSAVGIIPDNTQLKIVNGTDTINIVNVLDSDYSKPTTYKAMKQVCRYDTEIGWRWIFNVRYSVASDGSKVFVMPATATNVDTTDIYNKIDTKQDKSTAVNYNNITNCITEIPQDIKLELNNGTLTLKAGSKVYVPNGFESDGTTKKFDVVTIESDVQLLSSLTSTYLGGNYSWCYNNALKKIQGGNNKYNQIQSNTYDSSAQFCMFYDTTNNIIKYTSDSGATWETGYSLCFCLSSLKSGVGLTSIDQIFNGFGYIGSTVYALPGVKGLIPNGRNVDGSLKNIEVTVDKVLTATRTYNNGNYWNQHIYLGLNEFWFTNGYVDSVYMPRANNYILWYNPQENIMRYNNTDRNIANITDYPIVEYLDLGGTGIGDNTSKLTALQSKTAFHALDYNDKSTISDWSMPSNKYVDLTLGADGAVYKAPANGFFRFVIEILQGNFFNVYSGDNTGNGELLFRYFNVNQSRAVIVINIPIARNNDIKTSYTGTKSISCRFIYIEGELYNPVSNN